MKILFVTIGKHDDILNWSGTVMHMSKMLEQFGHKVTYLENLESNRSYFNRMFCKILKKLTMKKCFWDREKGYLKKVGRKIDNELQNNKYDLLFTPNSTLIAYVQSKIPMVLYTDANWGDMVDYYPEFLNISNHSKKYGSLHERIALEKCSHIFYSSEWAKKGAIKNYGISEDKISVVRFGANVIHTLNETNLEIQVKQRLSNNVKKILFVGVDWERKGGNVALQAVRRLNQLGMKSELIIVGCNPKLTADNLKYTKIVGFLNKQIKSEREKLEELFKTSNIFILPTLYECSPIVLAEASSYGLPSIARDTGGISSMLLNGVSGILMDNQADGVLYGDEIYSILSNELRYKKLCFSAIFTYKDEFTWDAVSKKVNMSLINI